MKENIVPKRAKKLTFEQIVAMIVLTVISVLIVVPIIYMLSISFSSEAAIAEFGYTFLPREFSLESYTYAFAAPEAIIQSYSITVFVTVVGTAMSLSMTTAIAYVASRRDYKLRKFTQWFLIIPLLLNGGMVSSYIIYTQVFNLANTVWALMLPYGVNCWFTFMMRGFMRTIPFEMIEAAKIDGASEFKTFFKIIIPLSSASIATIGLFYAFAFWNDWWLAMLYISENDLIPLQYYLQKVMERVDFFTTQAGAGGAAGMSIPSEGLRMALAVISAGPMLVVFPFFQRYFVKGVAVGSVKG